MGREQVEGGSRQRHQLHKGLKAAVSLVFWGNEET